MNKIKKTIVAVATGAILMANVAMPASAVVTEANPVDVSGNYNITFMLTGDLTPYEHHASFTQAGNSVTGDGGYPAAGGDTYHWNITSGSVSGNMISLTVLYDLGAVGTIMHMTGTITPNGMMSGTWDDNLDGGARTGTWATILGAAEVFIPTECNGMTLSGNLIVGTSGPDVQNGTSGNDLIYGLGGSDLIDGNGGDDCIVGGDGSDSIKGGAGKDTVLGGIGSDNIEGNGNDDYLYGNDGSDYILAGAGNDHLFGGASSDYLSGESGADSADGGTNNDFCSAEVRVSCP